MKKFISLLTICFATISLSIFGQTNHVQAAATGWHKVNGSYHYFVKTKNNQLKMQRIALVGSYLIDQNGNRHKLNLTKRGNHTRAAQRVAKQIASLCRRQKGQKQLAQVDLAAYYVSLFCKRDRYTMRGRYYDKAYGVFIDKHYSCAGSSDALGMVLRYMHFKNRHVNKGRYTHQWNTLKMDGKRGFADGQAGFANYGKLVIGKNRRINIPFNSILVKKMLGFY